MLCCFFFNYHGLSCWHYILFFSRQIIIGQFRETYLFIGKHDIFILFQYFIRKIWRLTYTVLKSNDCLLVCFAGGRIALCLYYHHAVSVSQFCKKLYIDIHRNWWKWLVLRMSLGILSYKLIWSLCLSFPCVQNARSQETSSVSGCSWQSQE